jgi:hypothetical protein
MMKKAISIPKLTFDDKSDETKEKPQDLWHDSE